MACEDHAALSHAESSAIDDMQKRNGNTRKERHNPQADALRCQLDNSLTRYTKSPQFSRSAKQPCTNFKNTVVSVDQCDELNNRNRVLSYTSVGDPASNGSQLLLGIQPPLTTSLLWRLVKAAVLVGHGAMVALS